MERVAVAVDDEGSGFPSEVLERAFEPFFTTRPTGTGIGLAVVRRVIEASDGRVVIGEAPNGGARVSLLLRRAPSSA
jgi:signal transduction histidine kinase